MISARAPRGGPIERTLRQVSAAARPKPQPTTSSAIRSAPAWMPSSAITPSLRSRSPRYLRATAGGGPPNLTAPAPGEDVRSVSISGPASTEDDRLEEVEARQLQPHAVA